MKPTTHQGIIHTHPGPKSNPTPHMGGGMGDGGVPLPSIQKPIPSPRTKSKEPSKKLWPGKEGKILIFKFVIFIFFEAKSWVFIQKKLVFLSLLFSQISQFSLSKFGLSPPSPLNPSPRTAKSIPSPRATLGGIQFLGYSHTWAPLFS